MPTFRIVPVLDDKQAVGNKSSFKEKAIPQGQHSIANDSNLERPSEYLEVLDSRTKAKYIVPITNNSVKAVDIGRVKPPTGSLNKQQQTGAGLKVFDRGFQNTACVESSITFIDGERGQIQFRDHDINYLFDNHDYEEVIFLLIWGHLPSNEERQSLRQDLASEMKVPQSVVNTIRAFPRESLFCTMIIAGLSAFAALDEGTQKLHSQHKPYFLGNIKNTDAAIIRALSSMAVTIALVYCHKRGHEFTEPDPQGSFIGNFLKMMGKSNQETEKCLERLWILYADHEMTNSTAAFLHVSSTLTDPISSSIAAMVSAYGPLHGGAIDLAYKGFEIIGSVDNVPFLIMAVKAKKQRLYGYGHRIYKTVDPRTKFIRQMIDEQVQGSKKDGLPLLDIALAIDKVASTDEYFTSRKLSANADLYGALLYTALGFESDTIIAMASLSRMAGVMAHWRESMQQSPMLWRPQQLYQESSQQAAPSD
ncbi:citrate synthase [Xylariaceae sp. FL1651]|nr:citrate synthase [Xylariaceae sp. FL1651]